MAKVEVIKSNSNTDKPNYTWCICIGIFIVLCILIPLLSNINLESEEDKYLNAPLSDCPNITLQEGIDVISSLHTKYGVDFRYELNKSKNGAGEDAMFLMLYDMKGLYNTNVYVPIDLVNGEIILGDFVYKIGGPAIQNSNNIKVALCNE